MSETQATPKSSINWAIWLGMGLGAAYYFGARPMMFRWGTIAGDTQRRLAGDDYITNPNYIATRAINIDAPPSVVWAWLAQMGRDGTGYYGLEWFNGSRLPSAEYIRHDLPALEVGIPLDGGYRILEAQSAQALVLGAFDKPNWFGSTTDISYSFSLEKRGESASRLLVRVRAYSFGWQGLLHHLLFEALDFIHTVMQLRTLAMLAPSSIEYLNNRKQGANGHITLPTQIEI